MYFKKYAMILINIVCLGLLSACSVPGSYFSESDLKKGYVLNGQQKTLNIIELNSIWLAQHENDSPQVYKIGPYDILNIVVWDHPELTFPSLPLSNSQDSGILVNEKGYIFFPFAGQVKVSGLTLDQARIKLEKKLKKYIPNPQLSLQVIRFRSQEVEVVGEVMKPGILPITDQPLSIMEAISQSGGVNSVTANTEQIFILYEKDKQIYINWFNAHSPVSLIAADKFYLQDRVIIYVPPAGVSAWNRVISQILPSLGGVNTAHTIAS